MILDQIGTGGFATEDFEILQQLGRIGTQEVCVYVCVRAMCRASWV